MSNLMDQKIFIILRPKCLLILTNDGRLHLRCSALKELIGLIWPPGYKTFFMLKSAEHEIYPAHKC